MFFQKVKCCVFHSYFTSDGFKKMQIWEFIWKLSYFENIQILLNQRFFFYSAIRLICRESNYIHEQKEVLTHTKAQISIFFFFQTITHAVFFLFIKGSSSVTVLHITLQMMHSFCWGNPYSLLFQQLRVLLNNTTVHALLQLHTVLQLLKTKLIK